MTENPNKKETSNLIYYPKRAIYIFQNKGPRRLLEEGIYFLIRKSPFQNEFLAEKADSLGILSPETVYSEEYYSQRKKGPSREDSHKISEKLIAKYEPDSVIDFGCAIGTYLEPFHKNNIQIKGVDANTNAFKHSVVPREKLEKHDLREKYKGKKEFDLVLSIEVAEHIPEKFADNFVESLTESCRQRIVMTAAPPGQEGKHHVNEQPREYWIEKFESRGFKYRPEEVEELRQELNLSSLDYVLKNLIVFKNEK